MKSKITAALSIILIIAISAGCTMSDEQQAIRKEAEKMGRESVGPYLLEKYGMENVTVKSVRAVVVYAFDIPDHYTGAAYVDCEFEGREFEVLMSSSELGFDNYQYPEIISAMGEYLGSLYGYTTYVDNANLTNKKRTSRFGLDEYFDGDFVEFLKNIDRIAAAVFILISPDIITIQEISDKIFDFVYDVENLHDGTYSWKRAIEVFFFDDSQENLLELDMLQEEAKKSYDGTASDILLARILFRTGDAPEIKYCHPSIDPSALSIGK